MRQITTIALFAIVFAVMLGVASGAKRATAESVDYGAGLSAAGLGLICAAWVILFLVVAIGGFVWCLAADS